ncbi:MAG: hypothetical protein L0H31_10615 [Nocardioidaceae bacterium]|nr:hypothetical protein [Nocardioidaceae bacterium]
MPKGTPSTAVGSVDVPNAVRGASTGFSILVIGGLLAAFVSLASELGTVLWLAAVAVLAFAVAARRSEHAGNPFLHGAAAAVMSYALVLPLLLPFKEGRDPVSLALTLLTALIIGPIAGWWFAERARKRR